MGVAGGVPYIAVVLLTLWSPDWRHTFISALVATAHTKVGYFAPPAGGFFHWLRLRDGIDAWRVTRAAAERGVAVTPGPTYFASAGGEHHIRLAFPALPSEDLREAIARLGAAITELR